MPTSAIVIPMLVCGIIFVISMLNAINPRFIWEKFESHNAKKEPSEAYFLLRRISGILGMLAIAAMMLFLRLKSFM